MKTPIVHELRRAGHLRPDRHERQKALVARSLVTLREPRPGWDERTRTAGKPA
jgi:hypothetical protein